MDIREKALNWLRKLIAQKLRALYFAENRHGVTQEELDNIREHIELLNYAIQRLEAEEG